MQNLAHLTDNLATLDRWIRPHLTAAIRAKRAGLPAPASAPGAAERRRGVPPAPGLARELDAVGVVDDAVHHRVRDGGFPDGQCIILSLHRVLDGVCQAGFMATLVDEFPDCIVLSWRFVEEACLAGSALPDHSL